MTGPEPSPEAAGPELDWQPQPERYYPDGRKRPQFTWPVDYKPSARRWHKKDGSTALDRAEAKRQAQEAEDNRLLSSRQLAEKLDREAQDQAPARPGEES